MHRIVTLVCSAVLLAGAPATAQQTDREIELVARYLDAFNSGHPERLADVLNAIYDERFLDAFGGAEAAAWDRLELRRTYGDLAVEFVDTVSSPAIVWTRGTVSRGWVGHQLYLGAGAERRIVRHSIWRARPVPYPSVTLTTSEVADSLREYLGELHGAGLFSGSVAASVHGETVLAESWGSDGHDPPAPITSDARFHIASVTKLLTATALLQLAEAGVVRLDDQLSRWIPEYPAPYGDDVRIRHLLTHTSGIELDDLPAYLEEIRVARTADDLLNAQIRHLTGRAPPFAPGTEYDYTSEGFDLAGVIIERATGRAWTDVVRERVLEPAGMVHTRFDVPRGEGRWALGRTSLAADLQTNVPGELRPAIDILPRVAKPSSGAWSTAEDLHRFMRALLDHRLLGPAWTDSLLTPALETGQLPRYGIRGWTGFGAQGEDLWGTRTVGHGGVVPGYSAAIEYLPQTGWLLTVLSNTGEATGFLVFQRFLELTGQQDALQSAIEDARAFADSLREATGAPGLAAAVAVKGKVVWSEGFGCADVEQRIPVEPTTRFRIGSISKLLTAATAALLHQQGRLDPDAPIQTYIPEFPATDPPITARHLAGHRAGIRHYGRDDYINRTAYRDVRESLPLFMGDSLRSHPGSSYFYSSYGYNLLGAVLQAATGMEFRRLVRHEVLVPLEMELTVAEEPGTSAADQATWYSRDGDGTWTPAPPIDLTDRWPSGGYLSTAEDLARFGAGVVGSDIFAAASRASMFTSQQTTDGEETGVGWGWRIGTDEEGRRILHHGGSSMGGRAFLLVYPDREVVVALLANLSFAEFGEKEAIALAELFLPVAGSVLERH